MIVTLRKTKLLSQCDKDIYKIKSLIANIILNGEKWDAFLLTTGDEVRIFTLTISVQHCIGYACQCNMAIKISQWFTN